LPNERQVCPVKPETPHCPYIAAQLPAGLIIVVDAVAVALAVVTGAAVVASFVVVPTAREPTEFVRA
jgi:hypothetical protein